MCTKAGYKFWCSMNEAMNVQNIKICRLYVLIDMCAKTRKTAKTRKWGGIWELVRGNIDQILSWHLALAQACSKYWSRKTNKRLWFLKGGKDLKISFLKHSKIKKRNLLFRLKKFQKTCLNHQHPISVVQKRHSC